MICVVAAPAPSTMVVGDTWTANVRSRVTVVFDPAAIASAGALSVRSASSVPRATRMPSVPSRCGVIETAPGRLLATYYINLKDDPIQMNGGVRHIAATVFEP